MQVFLFTAGFDPEKLTDLEARIRREIPDLRAFGRMEEIVGAVPKSAGNEPTVILFPVVLSAPQALDRMVSVAATNRETLFFIFISDDISASDYKRLVQTGGADWASTDRAPDEIREILARLERRSEQAESVDGEPGAEPAMVAFVPSAGGVGNSTIAIEVAIQLRKAKATRKRKICLVDLDFQGSHVCDLLDIEPRMQVNEIIGRPDRLDEQLFGVFVSHHKSGVDVIAAPRSRDNPLELDLPTLESLFRMIGQHYDLILLDAPTIWLSGTRQLLASAELVFVTGLNTIPGLRQVAETLKAVRNVERVPPRISVVLNRCEHNLVGGIARKHHSKNLLGDDEEVHFLREDAENTVESSNTGIPLSERGGRLSKDIAAITQIVAETKPLGSAAAGRT